MKKGVMGNGAASVILVFTVLCLTVFAVISLVQAMSDKAISDTAERAVKGYYEADTLAERVLARMIKDGPESGTVLDVEVTAEQDFDQTIVSFIIPVADDKELTVEAAISDGGCEVLVWKTRDPSGGNTDNGIQLFMGF